MTQLNKELQPVYSISDRLYFGQFAIYRRTISANFEHPLLKRTVCHKFHIATLEQYKSPKEFEKRVKDFGFQIDKTDRAQELKLFNVPSRDRQNYFFFEIIDGKKNLPLYYAAMYTRGCFEDQVTQTSILKVLNWMDYINACNNEISGYIFEQSFHPSCIYDLFQFFHDFGFDIYEWLDKESPNYIDEPLDSHWLNKCHREFQKIKEPSLRNYTLGVLQSVFQLAYKNQEVTQCQFCGRYIDYVKNKRFCSLASEKRDCGKRARNKRHYAKHRDKILPKAIRTNKELRAFYKEKGVKK